MTTFLIGLVILVGGCAIYGRVCEKVFGPDDRKTPALTQEDGVDFVPMKTWKNSLINLLNIAGTGPIIGPIQGILFGPIAFIIIPISCVIGGAAHDYFSGMISMRNDGEQMPGLVKKYLGKTVFGIYEVFVCLLLVLVGAVFVYTPGGIAATQVFGLSGATTDVWTWVIYGVIFLYYLAATLFPIDKIIGKIYPVFGAILLFSALGIFVGLFTHGYQLSNIGDNYKSLIDVSGNSIYKLNHFIPLFFITVACGMLSGFHSTQNTIISRCIVKEKEGRVTFYDMMVVEGFIAMVWAAAAMGVYNGLITPADSNAAVSTIGIVCKNLLGPVGGIIAILGVIVLPVTSGDTALRGLRLVLADLFHLDQVPIKNRFKIAVPVFALCAAIIVWAKLAPNGFTVLWRYFAWSNQTLSIFAFGIIAAYLYENGKKLAMLMPMIPGAWYAFLTCTYIMNAKIGFNIPWTAAYVIGIVFSATYVTAVFIWAKKRLDSKHKISA